VEVVVYLNHFGLSELPFRVTPDTSFSCMVAFYQEALDTLLTALQAGEGLVKISGGGGTGKTLLCRHLLRTLDDNWVSAYLPNPYVDPDTLFLSLAEELDIADAADLDQYHLLRAIKHRLLVLARAKKRVIFCIDESQAMPVETMEALRLVSSFETQERKFLHIVLFGQPELDARRQPREAGRFSQRIPFHYRLGGMKKNEIATYVAHRLRVAGYRGDGIFTPAAMRALYAASGGKPRLVNVLAHKALMSAFDEGQQVAKVRHVRLARKDTEGARPVRWWRWG